MRALERLDDHHPQAVSLLPRAASRHPNSQRPCRPVDRQKARDHRFADMVECVRIAEKRCDIDQEVGGQFVELDAILRKLR